MRTLSLLCLSAFCLVFQALGQGLPDVDFNGKGVKPGGASAKDASLPTLFFAGDSVSAGYAGYLKEALKGKFNCVYREDLKTLHPETPYPGYPGESAGVVKLLEAYFANPAFKPDVLLLNAGIHDVCKGVPLESYLDNLESLVEIAAKRERALVWVECSPFAEALAKDDQKGERFSNKRLSEYDKAASALMAAHGVPRIGFWSFHEGVIKAHPSIEEIYWDLFHQKPEVQRLQGAFLAEALLKFKAEGLLKPPVAAKAARDGSSSLSPSASAYLDKWKEDLAKNFNGAKVLKLAAAPAIAKTALLRFDLSSLPKGRGLSSAELVLPKAYEKDPGEIKLGLVKGQLDFGSVCGSSGVELVASSCPAATSSEKAWTFSGPEFKALVEEALKAGGGELTLWIANGNQLGYAGIANGQRKGPLLNLNFAE